MSDISNQSNLPATTKPPARRRIDATVIEEMAALVALKLNETQAALKLGLLPASWYKWKSSHRHDARFALALEKFRGEKLAVHLENIESASTGKNGHRCDWRSSAWMIERALSSDGRYGDRITTDNQTSVTVDVSTIFANLSKSYGNGSGEIVPQNHPPMLKTEFEAMTSEMIKQVYSEQPQKKLLDAPGTTKQLSEPGGEKP